MPLEETYGLNQSNSKLIFWGGLGEQHVPLQLRKHMEAEVGAGSRFKGAIPYIFSELCNDLVISHLLKIIALFAIVS